MKLRDIFKYLEKIKLHESLSEWFLKSYLFSIESRIISLHFAREIFFGGWKIPCFGYVIAKNFSSYLMKMGNNYDPQKVAEKFCHDYQKLMFCGINCQSLGKVAHITKLKYIKIDWGVIQTDDAFIKELPLKLKEQQIKIGNNGIAWFTALIELENINDAKTVCHLVGKGFDKDSSYILLSIPHNDQLCRPTIIDGKMRRLFKPHLSSTRWGMTLNFNTLKNGVPEAILKEDQHYAKLHKYYEPYNHNQNYISINLLEEYFESEKENFKKDDMQSYLDLENAWTNKSKWW